MMNESYLILSRKIIIVSIIILFSSCSFAMQKKLQIIQEEDNVLEKEVLSLEIKKLDLVNKLLSHISELTLIQKEINEKKKSKNQQPIKVSVELPGVFTNKKIGTYEFLEFVEQRKIHLTRLFNQKTLEEKRKIRKSNKNLNE